MVARGLLRDRVSTEECLALTTFVKYCTLKKLFLAINYKEKMVYRNNYSSQLFLMSLYLLPYSDKFGAEKIWRNWCKMAKIAKLNPLQIFFFFSLRQIKSAPNLIIFTLRQIKSMAKKISNEKIEVCFHTVNLLNRVFSL